MSEKALERISEFKRTTGKRLSLFDCGIEGELPQELSKLDRLIGLDLDHNPIRAQQKYLEISDAKYRWSDDPLKHISSLRNLRSLELRQTEVVWLDAIGELHNLLGLYLTDSKVADLEPIRRLVNLRWLDIAGTLVRDLSPLENLDSLEIITISRTKINDLSPLRKLVEKGIKIIFWECSITNPPLEILQLGRGSILQYWDRLDSGQLPLNESKIQIIGAGGAGKSSLVKRLIDNEFNLGEEQTNGILIRKQGLMINNEHITIRFWDFGGQEIMHGMHKFFLSRRSLYVIVIDARDEDEQVEYWLDHVITFGGNSKAIVVVNKIDENPSFNLDERGLRHKYGDCIDGFYRVSCKSSEGIENLQNRIHYMVAANEMTSQPFPRNWRALKDKLEELDSEYISYDRYQELCSSTNIVDFSEQETLLGFLDNIGVALHFKDLQRYNTAVLNPEWLTTAVYRVLNSRLIADANGAFEAEDLEKYLNDPRYSTKLHHSRFPQNKYHFIADVMEAFQLCYRLPERGIKGRTRYLIAELLPVQEPEISWESEGAVEIEVRYPGLIPPSIIPQVIVMLHPWVIQGMAWRSGTLLYHPVWEASAFIKFDKKDRRIRIAANGQNSRQMLSFIRDTLGKLHGGYPDLRVEEWVPLEGGRGYIKYSKLVKMEAAGEIEEFSEELGRKVKVSDLLNGVEASNRRLSKRPDPVRIAIIYFESKQRNSGMWHHKEDFLRHLLPFAGDGSIDIWNPDNILPGENPEEVLAQQNRAADIVLCLIDSEFLNSEYCKRQFFKENLGSEKRNESDIIPILVEPCVFESVVGLSLIKFANDRPISLFENRASGWTEVVRNILPVISRWKESKSGAQRKFGHSFN